MQKKKKQLTKEIVVQTWFFKGLEDLFFAFKVDSPFKYEPFFCALGFEMICKSFLLAIHHQKYEGLEPETAKAIIDKLAKKNSHKLQSMVKEIETHINSEEFKKILDSRYDDFNGRDFIKAMEAAYLECRYPVPELFFQKLPLVSSGQYQNPIASSGMIKFCFALTLSIVTFLKEKFSILIPKKKFLAILSGNEGQQFLNLFFKKSQYEVLD